MSKPTWQELTHRPVAHQYRWLRWPAIVLAVWIVTVIIIVKIYDTQVARLDKANEERKQSIEALECKYAIERLERQAARIGEDETRGAAGTDGGAGHE